MFGPCFAVLAVPSLDVYKTISLRAVNPSLDVCKAYGQSTPHLMCISLRTVNPSLDVHNPTDSQSCSLGKSPGARSLARTLWAFRVESTTYGGGRLCQGSEALALV